VPAARGIRIGERTHYEPGTFCWVGLATSDPPAARAFYAALFGWEADDLAGGEAGTYTSLRLRGSDVAVLYRQTAEARAADAPPHWTSYVSVQDADAIAAQAGELGGAAVFREPFDVLDLGRVAAIRDPGGAILSLWQPRAHIGAALVNERGALCWNELATGDLAEARAFYGRLLGWEYDTDASGYTIIENAGRPNGGIRKRSEEIWDTGPSWLPWFTVERAEVAAHRAEQLGGRALVGPTDLSTGRLAVLADPQRAAFGVFEGETDP
jgi:uncharacterized protein